MSSSLRLDNERIASMVNAAWGERVAWVEDQIHQIGDRTVTVPTIVSKLVCGRLPGRVDYPPFFAGPARGRR